MAEERGEPVPAHVIEPEIPAGRISVVMAFYHLQSERPVIPFGGIGRIPWSQINAYGQQLGLRETALSEFVAMVMHMDDEFIRIKQLEMNKTQGEGGNG